MSVCRHTTSTATATSHAAVQQTAASTRPRVQSRPAAAIERAQALAAEAELLLVVGSSLEVHPVAALPGETIASGGAVAIVNRGATPWDSRAEIVIDCGAGRSLRALESALAIVESDPARRSDG